MTSVGRCCAPYCAGLEPDRQLGVHTRFGSEPDRRSCEDGLTSSFVFIEFLLCEFEPDRQLASYLFELLDFIQIYALQDADDSWAWLRNNG